MQMEQQQRPTMSQRLEPLLEMLRLFAAWLLNLLRQPFIAVESLLFVVIGGWAFIFFANPLLFGQSIVYAPMRERGPPSFWGWRATVLIGLWIVALRFKNDTLRVLAQIFMIGWYSYLSVLFYASGQLSFILVSHMILCAYGIWCLWRFAGRRDEPE